MLKMIFAAAAMVYAACAPVSVYTVSSSDFARHAIPRMLVLVNMNNAPATTRRIDELSADFVQAGFTVVRAAAAEARVRQHGFTLAQLLAANDYARLADAAGIDGLVQVREFFGTEVELLDVKDNGALRAAGCWRTTSLNIVNEIIDQLRGVTAPPRMCPVRTQ